MIRYAVAVLGAIILTCIPRRARAEEHSGDTSRPPQNLVGRVTGGAGTRELFLGREHTTSFYQFSIGGDVGFKLRGPARATAGLMINHGRSSAGLIATRVALGGAAEVWVGPVVFALGGHVLYFGAARKSSAQNDTLWRLGVGPHASVLFVIPSSGSVAAHFGVHGDLDVLLALHGNQALMGGLGLVGGITFR